MEKIISDLFEELHSNPEKSEEEIKTKEIIKNFINHNTNFVIHDLECGLYCAYIRDDKAKNILVRADYDAVTVDDKTCKHLCGHDGHTTALCALAYLVYKNGCNNNVYFLFQGAEENGQGALKCMNIFDNKIDEVYGVHNLPGFEYGQVYTSKNTFALASTGMGLVFEGKPSHAAYPENGISPHLAIADMLKYLSVKNQDGNMCTICGGGLGRRNFGVSSFVGSIYMTIRSTSDEKLDMFKNDIIDYSNQLAKRDNLSFRFEYDDSFPATINNPECAENIIKTMDGKLLETPMRWSEDFGWYLKNNKGAFMGIGSGNIDALHTENYCYPKELAEITASKLFRLINK